MQYPELVLISFLPKRNHTYKSAVWLIILQDSNKSGPPTTLNFAKNNKKIKLKHFSCPNSETYKLVLDQVVHSTLFRNNQKNTNFHQISLAVKTKLVQPITTKNNKKKWHACIYIVHTNRARKQKFKKSQCTILTNQSRRPIYKFLRIRKQKGFLKCRMNLHNLYRVWWIILVFLFLVLVNVGTDIVQSRASCEFGSSSLSHKPISRRFCGFYLSQHFAFVFAGMSFNFTSSIYPLGMIKYELQIKIK